MHIVNYQERSSRGMDTRKPKSQRPLMSINLARLAGAVDTDVLSSALGVSGNTLKSLMDGRDLLELSEHQAHIAHRMEEAGFPRNWLNSSNATILPPYVNSLRKLASGSSNKGPIRRSNLKKLLTAFSGRHNVLADALEVNEDSLHAVVDGQLDFDEQRLNHFNPRLMEAGFDDNWLEQPDAGLTNEMVDKLEALANDSYERSFEETTEAPVTLPATTLKSQPIPESPPAPPPAQAQSEEKQTSLNFTPPEITPKPSFVSPSLVQPVNFKEPSMSPTQPQSTPVNLPRGVLAAGRPLVAKVKASPAAKKEKPATTPKATKAVAPTPTKAAAPQVQAVPAPRRALGLSRDDGVTQEQSLIRAGHLEKLLETARRGTKVTLWRDLLGSSLPYWGNIRKGSVLLRDELADRITNALDLPTGWLDNPTFPPASLAAWVTDANIPLPGGLPPRVPVSQSYSSVQKPVMSGSQPGVKARKPEPQLTMAPAASVAPVAPPARLTPPVMGPMTITAEVDASHNPAERKFFWRPDAHPTPIPAPGPLTQALCSIINLRAVEGKFTEQDAIRLLDYLGSQS